jgi:VanZ family protein
VIRKRLIQFIAIFVLISIAYLSLSPKPAVTASNDKLGHFIAYAVLTFFLLLAFQKEKRNRIVKLVGLSATYGVILEVLQLWVPGRHFSYLDLVANVSGVIIGYFLYFLLKRYNRNLI